MEREVLHALRSPLQAGQAVLTLSCGDLHSFYGDPPYPKTVDCKTCDSGVRERIKASVDKIFEE